MKKNKNKEMSENQMKILAHYNVFFIHNIVISFVNNSSQCDIFNFFQSIRYLAKIRT